MQSPGDQNVLFQFSNEANRWERYLNAKRCVREESEPKVLLVGENETGIVKDTEEAPFLIHNVYGGFKESSCRVFKEYAPTLRTPQGGGHIPFVVQKHQDQRQSGKPPRVFKEHSPTLRANPGDTQPYVVHNNRGILKESEIANCIDANYWKGMDNHAQRPMVVSKDTEQLDLSTAEIRKLLPVETERLMSLIDDWTKFGITESGETKELSDTQRYKLCGNGVVVDVVSEIIKKIKEFNNG